MSFCFDLFVSETLNLAMKRRSCEENTLSSLSKLFINAVHCVDSHRFEVRIAGFLLPLLTIDARSLVVYVAFVVGVVKWQVSGWGFEQSCAVDVELSALRNRLFHLNLKGLSVRLVQSLFLEIS